MNQENGHFLIQDTKITSTRSYFFAPWSFLTTPLDSVWNYHENHILPINFRMSRLNQSKKVRKPWRENRSYFYHRHILWIFETSRLYSAWFFTKKIIFRIFSSSQWTSVSPNESKKSENGRISEMENNIGKAFFCLNELK